jgi:hypothetical protein
MRTIDTGCRDTFAVGGQLFICNGNHEGGCHHSDDGYFWGPAEPLDHKTCGHIDHTTLDPDRLHELHSALLQFVGRTASKISRLRHDGFDEAAGYAEDVLNDFIRTAHEYEVER